MLSGRKIYFSSSLRNPRIVVSEKRIALRKDDEVMDEDDMEDEE